MPATLNEVDSGTLASSTQSNEVGACKAVNLSLSGTWTGTAALQRYIGGQWVNVKSWTANVETIVQLGARPVRARIDFTRTSGSLVYALEADDGRSAAVAVPDGDSSAVAALQAIQASAAIIDNTGASVAVTLTRTNDTNAYTANDVIGAATGSTAALTFANMGPSGGTIMITSAQLEIDASALISGETSYALYLYNVTPPSALGDNAAFDIPSGDRAAFLGKINLGTPVDEGSTLYVEVNGINKQVKLAGTSLFAYLVTVGAYTPTASRVHVVTLHAIPV